MIRLAGFDVSTQSIVYLWYVWRFPRIRNKFCMLQISKGMNITSFFEEGYKQLKDTKLLLGLFHETDAANIPEIIAEADMLNKYIEENEIEVDLPLFLSWQDYDDTKQNKGYPFSKDNNTAMTEAFCKRIKMPVGVKAPMGWLDVGLEYDVITQYPVWNVEEGKVDNFCGSIWQYAEQRSIRGNMVGGDYMYLPDDDSYDKLMAKHEKLVERYLQRVKGTCNS